MSLKNPVNDAWKKEWAAYAKKKKLAGADKPLTNDPMEAAYIGIHMWKQAVEKAKSTDVDKVIAAMARPDLQGALGHHLEDGREEPPPAQGGVHRRSEGRRPVQRGLEDQGPGQGRSRGARSSPATTRRRTSRTAKPSSRSNAGYCDNEGAAAAAPSSYMRILLIAIAVAVRLAARSRWTRRRSSKLGFGDGDEKIAAIAALVAEGDAAAAALLQAAGRRRTADRGQARADRQGRGGHGRRDRRQGRAAAGGPARTWSLNNRLRRELGGALAALKLISPDRAARLAAAKELAGGADEAMLPLIKKALARETDAGVKQLLELTAGDAGIEDRDQGVAHRARCARSACPPTRTPRCCCSACWRNPRRAPTRSPTRTSASRRRRACGRWRAARLGRARRPAVHRHLARLDPAARRARPRHHLRADGRDQHGARRADHGRRLHHLRGAEPVQAHRFLRLVPAGGGAGVVRRRGRGRHGARARW